MIVHGLELPLAYAPITGPGVYALENRKEVGSPVEVSEEELRQSMERVKAHNIAALKRFIATVNKRLLG